MNNVSLTLSFFFGGYDDGVVARSIDGEGDWSMKKKVKERMDMLDKVTPALLQVIWIDAVMSDAGC